MAFTFKHGDRPLDDYTIQRAVGSGGFGEVYYAISDGGREVALKYLRDNPQVELRGVSNCINLKSPHLVSIFDVKKNADDEYFIIMEYCSGPSLRDLLIAEPNGFSPEKSAFFVREIAKGIAYLHDRGIVHRDLKPGNIFWDDGYAKICDYGLSKFISVSRHSVQTSSIGTVHYMAPEIGSGNYSRGVDIYALGVMLYEMLLGRVPFEGSTMGEVLMKHLTAQPEVDRLPEPFSHVIRRALQKDPKDRYLHVDEMVQDMLSVETVQKSLAGFSPTSLAGAIRRGGTDDMTRSPMPSPNLSPGLDRGRVMPPPPPQPYTPQPVGSGAPLPDRVSRRMEKIAQKIDKKMAKMAGKTSPAGGPNLAMQVAMDHAHAQLGTKNRWILVVIMMIGFSVGMGVIFGNVMNDEDMGISAAMLTAAMAGGQLLSRKCRKLLGVEYEPKWARRLVSACVTGPLLALGSIPMFESRHVMGSNDTLSDWGLAVFLGLVLTSVFANWEKEWEKGSDGEMSFGTAIGAAIGALIFTMIASLVTETEPDSYVALAAAVAGVASLITQAAAWGFHRPRLIGAPAGLPPIPPIGPLPAADAGHATPSPMFGTPRPSFSTLESSPHTIATGGQVQPMLPKMRGFIGRAIWSLIGFVAMAGSIFLFIAIFLHRGSFGEGTQIITSCIGATCVTIFALWKTTPRRRIGIWRETVRPFVICVSLFGLGASITALTRGVPPYPPTPPLPPMWGRIGMDIGGMWKLQGTAAGTELAAVWRNQVDELKAVLDESCEDEEEDGDWCLEHRANLEEHAEDLRQKIAALADVTDRQELVRQSKEIRRLVRSVEHRSHAGRPLSDSQAAASISMIVICSVICLVSLAACRKGRQPQPFLQGSAQTPPQG